MESKNFKQELLDILGLKVELNQPKDESWTKDSENKIVGAPNKDSSPSIQNYIRKIVDNKIKNDVNKTEDLKERKNLYNKYTKDLKSFTLDDILKHVKGFDIGKGVYGAKEDDYIKKEKDKNGNKVSKEGRAVELGIVNNWIKKECKQGTIGNWFTIRKNVKDSDLKIGNLILALYSNDEFNQKSPAQDLENGIHSIVGGVKNPGATDAIKDMESGVDISIKCYQKNKHINLGSSNAIGNYKREVKVLTYNYRYVKEDSNEFKKLSKIFNGYKSLIICEYDPKNSGYIRDGKFYKEGIKKGIGVGLKKDYMDYNTLKRKLKKLIERNNDNKEIVNAINKYLENNLKDYQFRNKSSFKEIYANLENDIKKYITNKEIKIKGLQDLMNNIVIPNDKSSIKTNYFNY